MGMVGLWQIALVLAIVAVIVLMRFRKRLGRQLRTELQGSRPVQTAENAANHRAEPADRPAPRRRSAWIVSVIVIAVAAGTWWVAAAN